MPSPDPRSTLPGLSPAYIEVRYGDAMLVPAPLIAYQQSVGRDEAKSRETVTETRTLRGAILTSGIGYHFVNFKQEELETAFSVDNLEFTISASASNPCLQSGTFITSGIFPRVISIDIQEDVQFNRLDYTIVLENDVSVSGEDGTISEFSNVWDYSENSDECSVEISHSVSAQGVNTAVSGQPSNALENAKLRVLQFVGLSSAPSGFPVYVQPVSGSDVGFYELNTSRSETANVEDGEFSVSEQFRLVSGVQPYIDQRTAQYQTDEEGITNVVLNGTVRGLGRTNDGVAEAPGRSSGGTGFANALSGFNSDVRPDLFSDALGVYVRYLGSGTLSDNIQGLTITQNQCNGTITYSATFTDDPAEDLPSGIIERTCSIQITDPVREVAAQTAPFRALGQIFQRICTTTPGSYQVQCTVRAANTGDNTVDTNRAIEFAEQEMTRLAPNPPDYNDLYISSRTRNIDDISLSITASLTWTFAQDLATVPGDTAPVSLGRIF
jgi:hypothetical protein